jgi:hypothetical protein
VWAFQGAAMYLADQGADVIKIDPLWGDDARRVLTQPPVAGGESRAFLALNRNKRGPNASGDMVRVEHERFRRSSTQVPDQDEVDFSAQALYSPYRCQDGRSLILVVLNGHPDGASGRPMPRPGPETPYRRPGLQP